MDIENVLFDFEDETREIHTDIEYFKKIALPTEAQVLHSVDAIIHAFVPEGRSGRKVPRDMPDSEDRKDLVDYTKVQVAMDQQAWEYLRGEVPWLHLSYQPTKPHDHPISHQLTEINEAKVVERFGKQPFIDVFGNPRRHARYGRNAVSYVAQITAKDHIREHVVDGTVVRKFESIAGINSAQSSVKHILLTHTAYYLSADEIGELLHAPCMAGRRRIYAIVHRHPNQAGFLNNGELEYSYVDEKTVRQWSVSTGEAYEHPSMEPWFHQSSCTTTSGPIAWTTSKLAGDSWLLEMVGAPGLAKTAKLTGLAPNKHEVFVTQETSTYKVCSFLGRQWVVYLGPNGDATELHDVELFEILRRHIAGRERNAQQKKDLTLLARRLCDKRDIFAKYQSEHDIRPEQLMAYVEAAFHADLQAEIDLMLSYRREHATKLSLHAALMSDAAALDNSWVQTIAQTGQYVSDGVRSVVEPTIPALSKAASFVSDAAISAAFQVPLALSTGKMGLHRGIATRAIEKSSAVLRGSTNDVLSSVVHDDMPIATTTVQLLEAMTKVNVVKSKRIPANAPLPGSSTKPPPYRAAPRPGRKG